MNHMMPKKRVRVVRNAAGFCTFMDPDQNLGTLLVLDCTLMDRHKRAEREFLETSLAIQALIRKAESEGEE